MPDLRTMRPVVLKLLATRLLCEHLCAHELTNRADVVVLRDPEHLTELLRQQVVGVPLEGDLVHLLRRRESGVP